MKRKKRLSTDEVTFNRLRKRKDYSGMGWWFWQGFMNDKRRPDLNKLYDKLTREEKELCEVL